MGWRSKLALTGVVALAFAWTCGVAQAECKIEPKGQLRVALDDGLMTIAVTVNGHPAKLILNTAAQTTVFSERAVLALGMRDHPSVSLEWRGAKGDVPASVVDIDELGLGGSKWKKVSILTSTTLDLKDDVIGILGRDILGKFDIDLNAKDGVISLLSFNGCSDPEMIYWGGSSYSEAPLEARSGVTSAYITNLTINGRLFRAYIDTGAARTTIDSGAAQLAGVRLKNVVSSEGKTINTSLQWPQASFARFDTISIGDESVRNGYLRIVRNESYNGRQATGTRLGVIYADPSVESIGMDFFMAHRVLISNSRSKIMFTYSGGQIFPSPATQLPAESLKTATAK